MKKLSVIIPVYNEKAFIEKCVNSVLASKRHGLELEIVISDNNSNDGTKEILNKLIYPNVKIVYKEKTEGKGANIINAIKYITGDIIIVQDADLEYSPDNYEDLILPIIENYADVVYGTRFSRAKAFHVYSFPHNIANYLITLITNILFNKSFSDVCTGYKVFKSDCIKEISLSSLGYDFDTEITAKFSKNNAFVK